MGTRHVTHTYEACHMHKCGDSSSEDWVMSHIWTSHVTHLKKSCHTYGRGRSHIQTSHVTHIWMSHVTQLNESCHTSECAGAAAYYTDRYTFSKVSSLLNSLCRITKERTKENIIIWLLKKSHQHTHGCVTERHLRLTHRHTQTHAHTHTRNNARLYTRAKSRQIFRLYWIVSTIGATECEGGGGGAWEQSVWVTAGIAAREVASRVSRTRLGDQVCCSVYQSVAVCCSVLQCVAVCCSVLKCAANNRAPSKTKVIRCECQQGGRLGYLRSCKWVTYHSSMCHMNVSYGCVNSWEEQDLFTRGTWLIHMTHSCEWVMYH